jgi:quercetin dioxygenase-like cupin family protein
MYILKELDDHRDARGWVLNPFGHYMEGSGMPLKCHAFSIEPGCSRGGHRHPGRNEEMLVLCGSLDVEMEGEPLIRLSQEDHSLLVISAGTGHRFTNRTGTTVVVLCWSPGKIQVTGDDTVPWP